MLLLCDRRISSSKTTCAKKTLRVVSNEQLDVWAISIGRAAPTYPTAHVLKINTTIWLLTPTPHYTQLRLPWIFLHTTTRYNTTAACMLFSLDKEFVSDLCNAINTVSVSNGSSSSNKKNEQFTSTYSSSNV